MDQQRKEGTLYLESLKIHGFKSFAKRTRLDFKDGITAIVGPNGCGKSNIVDAIRWVLGEQKAGSLRSERMENVIFNGSKSIKPLGMSEVSLTIHNTRNVLPIEYAEVVITRRLFRSLESQYLLNNTPCRLRDILDLFMDTGMGSNAYSIIELSMVESLLNGKPEERRHIFEEAAGVTKYKLRRRAAFRKLEATEADLLRVNDIISEVEKNVSSLQRQVRKAKRFQELQTDLREKEIRLATQQYSEIKSELEPLLTNLQQTQDNRIALTAKFDEKEAAIEEERRKLLGLERNLSEQQKELNQLAMKIQKKEEQILVDRERRRALEDKKGRLLREKAESTTKLDINQGQIRGAGENLQQLFEKIQLAENDYHQKDAELIKVERRIQDKNEHLKSIENQRLQAVEGLTDSKKEEERIKTQLEHIRERVQAIEGQCDENELLEKIRQDKISKFLEKKEHAHSELRNYRDAQEAKEAELSELTENKDVLREQILQKSSELQTLKERIELLKKFIESYEDHPEGVQHLIQEGYLNGESKGTLAENLQVDNIYRQAVETALGEAAVSLIVEETDQALRCIEVLKVNKKGNVTFFPIDRFRNGHRKTAAIKLNKSEGVVDWAYNLVECSDVYRPLVKSLLGEYIIVENMQSARRQAELLQGERINLITLDGEVLSTWGPIKGGGHVSSEAGVIGRKEQVEQLQIRLQETFAELGKDEKEHERLENLCKDAFAKRQELVKKLKAAEENVNEVDMQLAQLEFESKRESESSSKLQSEKDEQLDYESSLTERAKTIAPSLTDLEENKWKFESEYKQLNDELAQLDVTVKEYRDIAQDSRMVLVGLKGEERHLQENSAKLQEYNKELRASLRRTNEEITSSEQEHKELEKRIDDNKKSIEKDFEQHREFEKTVHELEQTYQQGKETLEIREKHVKELRNERDMVSESFHGMELRVSELQMRSEKIRDRIKEEYNFQLEKAEIDVSLDVQQLQDQIGTMKNRLNSMGPVNLLALQEFEKEQERLDFMQTQKNDLVEAEANLAETIRVINKTAREQFVETFEKIRDNFITVFSGFFEDGKANLSLADSSDPLEAEIIIEADPKGRRLSALTLLSGGEKTLTAISILFAIYLVKPSPFCILDEVDAPLDDANIGRFVNAIRKFSDNTQFLIVTHNKLTMRAADCLYGITMEQEGVSKVVSVDFEEMQLN
jgi:chromosome segregation protein